jgi:asparagine synthase (glutamine-hydrolysing)
MCGIAGHVCLTGRPSILASAQAMADSLRHRGPDDCGVWASSDGGVALSQRRLSIIDLSPLGRNPMPWDGGRLWITFNGEIYNFLELREELQRAGHRFRSQTDTEVILAAYDQWGTDAITRLVGMFAFGLWDSARRRLWLVRDRLGKKPLYYTQRDSGLQFASELKALLVDQTFRREVDAQAIGLYLRYGYVPSPYTIFKDARKLPPAHYLLWENGRAVITRYWDPVPFAASRVSLPDREAETELESRLTTAVKQRLIADVPLGAFLSGGIDSSLVVALMNECGARPVRTFSIRFDNPEYNEADHAAAVARHLGTDHYEQTCSDRDMLATVDRLPEMFDEPFADSSAIPTFLVSKIARERVTVALSGDGGDELFLGYPRHTYHASAAWALSLPGPVRRAAAIGAARMPTRRLRRIADVLRSDEADRYARFITWWNPEELVALTGRPPADAPFYADALSRAQNVAADVRPGLLDLVSYLPDDILTKVDRASMAVALEVRAPLLDHRIVELALALPLSLKRRGRTTKGVLRKLLYKRVPRQLVDRPKMGFGVPLDDWFRGPLRERMNVCCSGTELEELGIDASPIRQLWSDFQSGRTNRADRLWQIYTLVAWSQRLRPEASRAVAATGSAAH